MRHNVDNHRMNKRKDAISDVVSILATLIEQITTHHLLITNLRRTPLRENSRMQYIGCLNSVVLIVAASKHYLLCWYQSGRRLVEQTMRRGSIFVWACRTQKLLKTYCVWHHHISTLNFHKKTVEVFNKNNQV